MKKEVIMRIKDKAIPIITIMIAVAMIMNTSMAAICDESCGTKVLQCTNGAATEDAVYALILPGVTGAGTLAAVPSMAVGWVDIGPQNNQVDPGECVYVDTNFGNGGTQVVQTGDVRLCGCCDCPPNTVVGECTCTGYTELGSPLTYPNQRMVRYNDQNGNGFYDIEDHLYLDMDLSNDVNEGDVRLTPVPPHDAYTVVVFGESGNGRGLRDPATNNVAVANVPVAGTLEFNDYVGFVDSACDGQWSTNGLDKLYLQQLVLWPANGAANQNNQFDAFVTIGDFRLYMPLEEPCWPDCGTKVQQCDPDAVYSLLIPGVDVVNPARPVAAMQFRWVDANSNGFLDPEDHSYVDTDSAGTIVEMGDIRLSECCGCLPNTMVGICGTCDLSPPSTFAVLSSQDIVGYVDSNVIPNGIYDLEDPLYLDIGGLSSNVVGSGNGVVSIGDIRLTEAAGYAAWSVVVNGHDDLGDQLRDSVLNVDMPLGGAGTALNAMLGFVDSECDGEWSIEANDKLYLQQINTNHHDAFVTIGDHRLFIDESKVGPGPDEPCWLECGTKVKECDVDVVYALTLPAMQFSFTDKNGDGVFNIINNECAYIDTNIVDVDLVTPGIQTRVAVGDVRLCSCCDEEPNTVVETCDFDELGQPLSVPIAFWAGTQIGLVGYVDLNADPFQPSYDVSEPLYLDCGGAGGSNLNTPLPMYADGRVSTGDIRLTGRLDLHSDYTPYSVVNSGDLDDSVINVLLDPKTDIPTIDVFTSLIPTPTFNNYLGFRDSNCDGAWDRHGGDELYLQQLVPAPDPFMVANSPQFNLFSTIGDFRIYMPDIIHGPDYHSYDTNKNCKIDMDELMIAIGDFKTGSLEMGDLMEVIGFWKAGSYC